MSGSKRTYLITGDSKHVIFKAEFYNEKSGVRIFYRSPYSTNAHIEIKVDGDEISIDSAVIDTNINTVVLIVNCSGMITDNYVECKLTDFLSGSVNPTIEEPKKDTEISEYLMIKEQEYKQQNQQKSPIQGFCGTCNSHGEPPKPKTNFQPTCWTERQ